MLQLTQPSVLRLCPPCPLILQTEGLCVHEVHLGLALTAQNSFSAGTCKFSHCFYQTLSLEAVRVELG